MPRWRKRQNARLRADGMLKPGLDHVMSRQHSLWSARTVRARRRRETAFGPTAVKTQRPISSDDDHRVVKFRPRTSAQPPGPVSQQGKSGTKPDDLPRALNAAGPEEPDDFRHRMLANLAAFAFTVALTAIGIWLAREHRRIAQDPGLRPDGTPRLRPDFLDPARLIFASPQGPELRGQFRLGRAGQAPLN